MADHAERAVSYPMRRFYLQRHSDDSGISRRGRVLEGALLQSGKVIVEWRPPLGSLAIYNSFEQFLKIHVTAHAYGANAIVWLETREAWHCLSCGAGGWIGHACELCGGVAHDDPAFPVYDACGHKELEDHE
jgi:hypothetical protein